MDSEANENVLIHQQNVFGTWLILLDLFWFKVNKVDK